MIRVNPAMLLIPLLVLALLAGCARLSGSGAEPGAGSGSPTVESPTPIYADTPVTNQTPLPPTQTPATDEKNLSRGEVFVRSTDLLIMESYPLQVALIVKGELPTPCHRLKAEVEQPDAQNRIQVRLYSLYDPAEICIQMLQSFEERISLGSYADGSYTVYLNGEKVGEFTQ